MMNHGEAIEKLKSMARPMLPSSDSRQALDYAIAYMEPKKLSEAPCDACGYNGAGYYQPDTHPCAAKPTQFDERVAEAKTSGCGEEFAAGLSNVLVKYVDVFRLTLGRDPPVKMPPLKVHLKPDAKPVRCKARRYLLPQRDFMKQHMKELEEAGFVYRNPVSRWASAPLIVRKPHTKDGIRMTVDLRPVNGQTEQIA
jgi:hypothetical protein